MPRITHAARKLPVGLFALALLPLLLYFASEQGVSSNMDAWKVAQQRDSYCLRVLIANIFFLAGIISYRMEKHTKECFIVP